ncbi:hypothetical protein Q8A67_018737 [Cirrhinus molitorella]|uniref:Uncharacterized protein n=1 Tax=Cirrhinus molitorella TaxID=172907 RepID=A0AA88PI85_9TELE|nr:hypothetical protein Q8A67_018737 [Cirrhinus molitorella]
MRPRESLVRAISWANSDIKVNSTFIFRSQPAAKSALNEPLTFARLKHDNGNQRRTAGPHSARFTLRRHQRADLSAHITDEQTAGLFSSVMSCLIFMKANWETVIWQVLRVLKPVGVVGEKCILTVAKTPTSPLPCPGFTSPVPSRSLRHLVSPHLPLLPHKPKAPQAVCRVQP